MGRKAEKEEKQSFRVLIVKGLLRVLIPLIALLIYYNFYSIYTYNKELRLSNRTILKMYSEELERTLQKTDVFLATIVANDSNYAVLRNKNSDLNTYLAIENIEAKFEGLLSSEKTLNGLIVYSSANKRYSFKSSLDTLSYADREQIKGYFLEYTKGGDNYSGDQWINFQANKKQYIMHIVGKGGTYVAAYIQLKQIEKPSFERLEGKNGLHSTYEVVLCDMEGRVLYNNEFMKEQNLSFGTGGEDGIVLPSYRYNLIAEQIEGSSMYMCLLIHKMSALSSVGRIQVLLLLVSIFSCGLIPLSLFYIKRTVTSPLNSLTSVMEDIKAGELDTRSEGVYDTKEFQEVNDTFNDMMAQITDLKITAYEREIDKQKAQLQYFQLQLQPHFYLNCLKNIYGMAQNEKYEKIQELIIAVSNHLRYMFQDNSNLVSLKEEIEFVNNYLEIQSIGSSLPPKCRMDIEPKCLDLYVPLLSIQTFIENSVKYGKPDTAHLLIELRIHLLKTEEGDFIDIIIEDNGKGYDESVIRSIYEHMDEVYADKNVGIHNIISRLKLLYGDKAEFALNNTGQGAYSELIIPVKTRDEDMS